MKKIFYKISLLSLLITGLVSCNDDEVSYDSLKHKPMVGVTATSYTASEGDDVMITLTSDVAYKESMQFKLSIVSGDAMDHDDFMFDLDEAIFENDAWGEDGGYKVEFPAFATSYTFPLHTILDQELEGTESVTFQLTTQGNMNGLLVDGADTFVVNIANRGYNVVDFTFDWDQSFDLGGTTYTLCDIGYDNDYYVFAGNDPQNFGNLVDMAASADCPETLALDLSNYADGDYYVYQNLWETNGLEMVGIAPAFSIPTTVSFDRPGSNLSGSYVQTAANAFDSDSPSDQDYLDPRYVITISVSGDIVTLRDDSTGGTTIGSGRVASNIESVKAQIKAANARRR